MVSKSFGYVLTKLNFSRIILINLIIAKPLRQKKDRTGLYERADYGVSSAKTLYVIWTAEGCVKCTDVRLTLVVKDMLVS